MLLSGTRDRLRPAVEGGAYIKDAVRGGGLVREESPRREALYTFGWTGFALVSLVAAMLVTFIMQDCPSSVVKVNPGGSTIGSLGAASDLEDSGSSAAFRNTNMVVSDSAVPAAEYPGLVGHPVAVVIFAVVVNRATGVSSLTESQLDGIWTGKYQNWRQLGGAKASPVTRCDVVLLAGRDPSAEAVNAGPNSYPFWAVEYMYTYGTPAPGTLLSAFLGYMSTDAAKSSLQNDGEIPCSLTRLCP